MTELVEKVQIVGPDGTPLAVNADGSIDVNGGGGGAPTDAQYYVGAASSGLSAEIVVPAFMQTLLDDTTAAAARATLGVPDWYEFWRAPSGSISSLSPWGVTGTLTLTSGTPRGVSIYLPQGFTVNSITFPSTTALGTGTHQYFALCDDDAGTSSGNARAVLAVSADDTSTAWPGQSIKTLNMTTPYVTTRAGWFYLVILVTVSAGSMPVISSYVATNAVATFLATSGLGGNSSSTGLTSIPATGLGAFTNSATMMLGRVQ